MATKRKLKYIIVCAVLLLALCIPSLAHPGRTDSNGGHWNHSTGEYHYHTGEHAGQSSSSKSSSSNSTEWSTKNALEDIRKLREEEEERRKSATNATQSERSIIDMLNAVDKIFGESSKPIVNDKLSTETDIDTKTAKKDKKATVREVLYSTSITLFILPALFCAIVLMYTFVIEPIIKLIKKLFNRK